MGFLKFIFCLLLSSTVPLVKGSCGESDFSLPPSLVGRGLLNRLVPDEDFHAPAAASPDYWPDLLTRVFPHVCSIRIHQVASLQLLRPAEGAPHDSSKIGMVRAMIDLRTFCEAATSARMLSICSAVSGGWVECSNHFFWDSYDQCLLSALIPEDEVVHCETVTRSYLVGLFAKVVCLRSCQCKSIFEMETEDLSAVNYAKLAMIRHLLRLKEFCLQHNATWIVSNRFDKEVIDSAKTTCGVWKKPIREGFVDIVRYKDGSLVIDADGSFAELPRASWDDKNIQEWFDRL